MPEIQTSFSAFAPEPSGDVASSASDDRQADLERADVLVVDDEDQIRTLVATILRRHQLKVDTARDGREALEKLRQRSYSVILLDLMMPKIDGFGVIAELRKGFLQQPPIVFVMTAAVDEMIRQLDPTVVH